MLHAVSLAQWLANKSITGPFNLSVLNGVHVVSEPRDSMLQKRFRSMIPGLIAGIMRGKSLI